LEKAWKGFNVREPKYICIEGVSGIGKTSLTKMLSEYLDALAFFERPEENPFLEDFYKNPRRFAFQVQIFFLLSRYRQQMEIMQTDLFHEKTVADYLFAKDRIFAHLNLEDRELQLYNRVASLLEPIIPKPDLVIYLQSDPETIFAQIRRKGRAFEHDISMEYVRSLNEAYNRFFFHYKETPLLVVNSTALDFVNDYDAFEELVKQILRPHSGIEYFSPVP
jgi:deoxyadenosine/deoxycytidine kinase